MLLFLFFGNDRFLFGLDLNATKKVAYAASFGTVRYESMIPDYVKKGLNELDAISVRETNSQAIVKSITNTEPLVVSDPTFIYDFENDKNIPPENRYGDYIVVYGSTMGDELIKGCVEYAKKHNLKIIFLDSLDDKFDWCEKNKMLQRIYGVCFTNEEDLNNRLAEIEEAKQRDHRKIGKDLEIFMNDELVGAGMPLWLPNGAIIRKQLENYIYNKEQKLGYNHVYTPCVGTVNLYKTSGHWDHYKENMFPMMKVDEEEFVLRPMNCPHHMLIYKNKLHSYRDLPIRIGEFATDFRYEASGAVKGLERVRCMCQNDAHLFVTPEQIGDEFKKVVSLILDVYKDFGIKNYKFRLSLRDPLDKHKYFDDDEMWNIAEDKLRST